MCTDKFTHFVLAAFISSIWNNINRARIHSIPAVKRLNDSIVVQILLDKMVNPICAKRMNGAKRIVRTEIRVIRTRELMLEKVKSLIKVFNDKVTAQPLSLSC